MELETLREGMGEGVGDHVDGGRSNPPKGLKDIMAMDFRLVSLQVYFPSK